MPQSRRALVLMAISSVCFAVMAFAAKLASDDLSGSQVAFLRFAFMLAPLLVVPGAARKAVTWQRLDLLFYRGLFGGTAVLLYFLAIKHIPVGIATLLNYSAPVFSVTFAAFFLGEKVDRRLLFPLLAALCGVVLAAGGGGLGGFRFGIWEAAGVASAILSGAAVTAIRAARRTEGSWAIYGSFTLFGLLATSPFGVPGFRAPTPREWLLFVVVGLTSVTAQLLMTYAYRWVTNLQAGVLAQLTVVLSMILGAVFLGDRLAPVQIFGALLALGGVVGVVWM
ncbi:MAG TPA: DMT family transporter, partial [Thermoanaerobaculia bacterium]|nr:DMT family transporter [Thermoanaerobaculia bacterium]